MPSLVTRIALCALTLVMAINARAETALIAVASNFAPTLRTLLAEYEFPNGHELRVATGSTGKLYAQIIRGAPFAVFLAADQSRPRLLEESGHAVPGSRFSYAQGRLALWSRDAQAFDGSGPNILRTAALRRVSIANPNTAPYGLAAMQFLQALDLADSLEAKLVRGENVGQALAFVASGGAEVGLVALSGIMDGELGGSFWTVPETLHAPIWQDAVLLARGAGNPAALAFLDYLRSPRAQRSIAARGYSIEHRQE